MRITQCYISKSVDDFPFMEVYGLTSYIDSIEPCIFFGCYLEDDLKIILNHKGLSVIVWCGQDSLDFNDWHLFDTPNMFHVSALKNVVNHVNNFVKCSLIKCKDMSDILTHPIILGESIYVYMPKSSEDYHGKETFDKLKLNYACIIGDGSISQADWRVGKADEIYSQCFIGLVLSNYAGGGGTIVELGVRGIRCVTNVSALPNSISWSSVQDVEYAIEKEAKNIGKVNKKLSTFVNDCLDKDFEFLNTEFYD